MTLLLLATLVCLPLPAQAQLRALEGGPAEQQALSDAHTLRNSGMALTLSGLATTAGGVGMMFSGIDVVGSIGGGTLEGAGGLVSLIGIPMWIAGAVRVDVLSLPADERASAARPYELAGMIVTGAGLLLAVVGAVLMATSASGATQFDQTFVPSVTLLPGGVALAAFVGAPLWAEGARF